MSFPVRRRSGKQAALAALGATLLAAFALALCLGAVRIPIDGVFHIFWAKALGLPLAENPFEPVLWHLRTPRVLLAVLVGSALSVAGALMQGLFRNPLADPALIGVSSGAALGAVFVIIFGAVFFPAIHLLSDLRVLPFAAFLGALVAALLIQRLASSGGYTAIATLLLAGVAVNSLAGALIGLSTFLATDAQLRTLTFWTLGSLGSADWRMLAIAAPFCLGLVVLAPLFAPALNALALGESEAVHLGFPTERIKNLLILVSAAGVGACVAFTGMIAFVGLVVPHIIRLWIGPDHRWLLPASALLGALLLVLADTAARIMVSPAELPIGILTAAFGAPVFLLMLLRQRRKIWL